MAWVVLLVAVPSASVDVWEYGPWTYYTFQPSVEITIQQDPAEVLVLFPQPADESAQKVLGAFQSTDEWKVFERQDKLKRNTALGCEIEVKAAVAADFGLTFCIGRRSVRLKLDQLENPTANLLPRERTRLKDYLELTSGTGLDDPALAEVAKSFASPSVDALQAARRIYERVLERMEYEKKLQFKGAGRAWQERVGECCDYASLFVSLCRQADIPARGVAGFAWTNEQWEHHVWAEFYLPRVGWVPCDPSFGDAGPGASEFYFAGLDDRRIALSRDFDLDFSPPEFLKTSILQEYLFAYSGSEQPEIVFQVQGKKYGEAFPADYRSQFGVRVVPASPRRKR